MLLFNAKSIFKGIFNYYFYRCKSESKASTTIAYDATRLNKYDFAGTSENLALQLNKHVTLLIPANNYDFTGTLKGKQIFAISVF